MTEFEDLIKRALRDDSAESPGSDERIPSLLDLFLRRSRWVAGFAWMKMLGTLGISTISAICFYVVDSPRGQLACAALCIVGFVAFAMWWTWYWQVLNRNAALREIKRLELQIAELRAGAAGHVEGHV